MSINGVTMRGVGARSAYIFDPAPADMAEQSMLGTIVEDFGLSEMESLDAALHNFLDGDESGTLTRDELRKLVKPWLERTNVDGLVRSGINEQIDTLLSELDMDGDGLVTPAELTAALKENAATLTKLDAALAAGQCVTIGSSPTQLDVNIRLPADMPCGEYLMNVDIGGETRQRALLKPQRLLVLFNPWSALTQEYIPDEAAADEYVMSEIGLAHFGNWRDTGKMGWNYGQFDASVLAAACKILTYLSESERADVALLARGVTRAINTQGRNGVLHGRWEEPYTGAFRTTPIAHETIRLRKRTRVSFWVGGAGEGHPEDAKPPTHWRGSPEILGQWVKTNKAVRYGQCWVFAGITTSVLRCLGLASRQVSNFRSAHDTHNNRMIEQYYDEDGNKLNIRSAAVSFGFQPSFRAAVLPAACCLLSQSMFAETVFVLAGLALLLIWLRGSLMDTTKLNCSGDSIWNFHVWNEVYMSRPDLPMRNAEGQPLHLGGWQACDATPQEESDGYFQCGPASIAGIRKGINHSYDADFIIGESQTNLAF